MGDLKEYTNHFMDGENIFYLNKKGTQVVGHQGAPLSKHANYRHTLMRNDLFIYYNMPHMWRTEPKFKVGEFTLIPDVFFKTDKHYFGEIDNTQSMAENRKKLERYKAMESNGAVQQQFGYFPVLIWLTLSTLRKTRIEQAAKEIDVSVKVFLPSDIR